MSDIMAMTPALAEVDGLVTMLEWRTDIDAPMPGLPVMVDVLVGIDDHDEAGMPSPREKDALAALVAPFLTAAGSDAVLVGARTAHGVRKWTLYASSPDWVGDAVTALRGDAPERLIVARVLPDPSWIVHEWHRQLTLRANGDLKLLAAHGGSGLPGHGVDPAGFGSGDPIARIGLDGDRLLGVDVTGINSSDQPVTRRVEWHTVFANEGWARLAAVRFEHLGLEVTVQPSEHGWAVDARVWMEVDLTNVMRGSATTRSVCDDLHGNYFGWTVS
jgi:hypothetical protein